jgi:hypothetical protein
MVMVILGRTDQEPDNNIFFIDDRTGALDNTFGIPEIPQEGAGNGVEGEIRVLIIFHLLYLSRWFRSLYHK